MASESRRIYEPSRAEPGRAGPGHNVSIVLTTRALLYVQLGLDVQRAESTAEDKVRTWRLQCRLTRCRCTTRVPPSEPARGRAAGRYDKQINAAAAAVRLLYIQAAVVGGVRRRRRRRRRGGRRRKQDREAKLLQRGPAAPRRWNAREVRYSTRYPPSESSRFM